MYNANKLASLVEKKKSLQNWLTYYQNKYERNPSKKPMTKVIIYINTLATDIFTKFSYFVYGLSFFFWENIILNYDKQF